MGLSKYLHQLLYFAILFSIILLCNEACIAQESKVLEKSEIMPEFPGGEDSLMKYIMQHVHYPKAAIDEDVQAKLTIGFVVDEHGKVRNVKIVNSKFKVHKKTKDTDYSFIYEMIKQEAIRSISELPNWKPGIQKGEAVSVRFRLPLKFQLED